MATSKNYRRNFPTVRRSIIANTFILVGTIVPLMTQISISRGRMLDLEPFAVQGDGQKLEVGQGTTATSITIVTAPALPSVADTCQCSIPKTWYAQTGQDQFLFQRLFLQQDLCCTGTFVEFGARDGIFHSNTFAFEHYMGWKGLLFELDPKEYETLEHNRPGATVIKGAVCPSGQSNVTVIISHFGGFSGLWDQYEQTRLYAAKEMTTATCYTLANELHQRGMTRVDYMTIDTEGSELDLVLDFPWDEFDVRVVQIEQLDEVKFHGQVGKKEKLLEHMMSHGYKLYNAFVVAMGDTVDLILVRNLPQLDVSHATVGKNVTQVDI